MPPVEAITDLDTLRQFAKLLYRENTVLQRKVRDLLAEIAEMKGEDPESIQQKMLQILASVESPRGAAPNGRTEDGPQAKPRSESERGDRPAQKGHGPRPQPKLRTQIVIHQLLPEQSICDLCDRQVTLMKDQFEESEEVTVVRREFVLVKHRRQKGRCGCNGNIVTAPGPVKLQPGSRYSPEFAVEVAIAKYLDHLPLERQVRMMRREGLRIDSQTLWDQINRLAHILDPTYAALLKRALSWSVVHADETSWRLMIGKKAKRWWVWELATPDTIYQTIEEERSRNAARPLFEHFTGILVTDGCGIYKSLVKERGDPGDPRRFRLAHCWAHARRNFEEIAEKYPSAVFTIMGMIRELYEVERGLPSWVIWPEATENREALEVRAKIRRELSKPIVDRIWSWAMEQRPLPRSDLGLAVRYLFEHWDGLTLFLKDPRVPLDNNAAERGLRGIVLGRKNHYGSRSTRGIHVAALFYSLLETAKLCGVDPAAYLLEVTRKALDNPGAIVLPRRSS